MKWSDQQRAQLLQIYKDKITQLGEEEFFARFDEIREEAYKTIRVDIDLVHVHQIQHSPQGSTGWAICECGASLRIENGQPVGEWHTCSNCTSSHGLDYVDPIHTSAATLGRLGGKVKSEIKTLSSRSNGKKGGRPAVKQLDLEEI